MFLIVGRKMAYSMALSAVLCIELSVVWNGEKLLQTNALPVQSYEWGLHFETPNTLPMHQIFLTLYLIICKLKMGSTRE
jgi:hypothetical protein